MTVYYQLKSIRGSGLIIYECIPYDAVGSWKAFTSFKDKLKFFSKSNINLYSNYITLYIICQFCIIYMTMYLRIFLSFFNINIFTFDIFFAIILNVANKSLFSSVGRAAAS